MSATGIIGNAVSGLNASQVALRNTSTNIANVNNPDYARREAVFETRTLGGVDISEIKRIANDFLSREVYAASSSSGAATATSRLHDRLQSVFGDPSGNTSFPGKLDAMFAELAELQLDPASPVRRATAIDGVNALLEEIGRVAAAIQDIRLDADADLSARIPIINDLLRNIHELNQDIVVGRSKSLDVNGFIDQRQKSLNALSELVDIRVSEQPSGTVSVSTFDGSFLVSNVLTELQYSSAAVANPDVIFSRVTLHVIDAASGAVNPVGKPFEPHLAAGELRGLLDMRDVELPKIAEELGELAAKVADQLNAIHNDSSAVPAPNQLAGRNTGLLATDEHGFSGASNFSIVDASGQTVVTVRADFSANQFSVNGGAPTAFGGTTIGDVVAAVNGALGANGTLSFTNGVMTLGAANPANGVAMVQDAAAPSSRAGRGFAHFFGMNDLVGANAPSHYQTGFVSTQAHEFGAGQTLRLQLINPAGQQAIDYTLTIAGTSFDDILTQLNDPVTGMGQFATFAMDASGALTVTPNTGYGDYTLFATSDQTDRGGTGVGLSALFGLGPGARQNQATGMAVRPDIVSNKNNLALATLEITAVGDIALSAGDARGALAIHALENQAIAFAGAGNLAAATLTLNDFAGQVISNTARAAAQAEAVSQDRVAIRDEILAQVGQVSGVNLDEELANLIVFQNAYNASARMIRAAEELLETLLSVV